MLKPKVSIIIPVYNAENYIRQCVESVINQTLDNIEIIIVNDGSTDNSINRIEDLIKPNNLLIVNQENKGLSGARNIGLSYATGDYVSFIDSDDYLENTFLEVLYNEAIKNDLDIVLGTHKKLLKDGQLIEVKRNDSVLERNIMNGKDYLLQALQLKSYRVEVWDDLYKREFLLNNDLYFYEDIIYEDVLFSPKCLLYAEKVKVIDNTTYIYRQRSGSIMNSVPTEKNFNSVLVIIDEMLSLYKNTTENKVSKSLSYLLRSLVFLYEENLRKSDTKNKAKFLKELKKRNIKNFIDDNRDLEKKLKIRYFILSLNTKLYLKFFYNKS